MKKISEIEKIIYQNRLDIYIPVKAKKTNKLLKDINSAEDKFRGRIS